jgi:hypothetical protein
VILAFGFAIPSPLFAQAAIARGTISGTVTDPSGAAVPGATVVATNVETGLATKTKTNKAGFYSISSLTVGTYDIAVSHSGFKTTHIKGMVLQVGQSQLANARLQVGAVSESVTVTGQSPLLQTTESSVSSVVNSTMIKNLPLNGRNYTGFVLLTPNTSEDGEFGLVSMGGQQGGGDSGYANGNGANSFMVDGASFTGSFFGGARGRTRVPYIYGENSVKEFQVSNNPYNAAYGGAGSGFVNMVTKSGTNTVHGDAFYYNRNSGVGNANNAIDKAAGLPTPLDILQQFGADIGGPIKHSKAWYYFDYEQQRRKFPISVVNPGFPLTGPNAFNETNFQNVPAGTTLPSPSGPYPVPGDYNTAPVPGSANYPNYLQQVSNALNAITRNLGQRSRYANDLSFYPKVDWQVTNSDHLAVSYNYNKFNSPGGEITFNPVSFAGDEALSNSDVRDQQLVAHWTHTFGPDLLNDLLVGYQRDKQLSSPSGLTSPNYGQFEMFSPSFFEIGNPTFSVGTTTVGEFQLNERVTYIVGRHTLNFGFDYQRSHAHDFFPGNFNGTYAFVNPTDFALGRYLFFSQAAGNPAFIFSFPYYGFYAQDKFQATPKLTLDMGLREDFQVFPQPQADTLYGSEIARLTGQFPNQYNRLSPRFGFAYAATPNTVVRGGFGIYREVLDGINYENSVISNGLPSRLVSTQFFFNSNLPANQQEAVFPHPLTSTSSFAASPNLSVVSPGFKFPYIMESSLEIQQQLLPNTTLSVGTMWTHGVHLISSSAYDMNLIPPTGTTTYIQCPGGFQSGPVQGCIGAPGLSSTLPNLDSGLLTDGLIPCSTCANGVFPGQVNALISPGNNNYNSFYVQLQQRDFHGLTSMLSYTFAKDLQSNGVDFNNQFSFANTEGPSLLDQRNRLALALAYMPQFPHFSNQYARKILKNWSISSVMTFASGRPYTGLLETNNGGAGDNLNDSAINQTTSNTAAGLGGFGSNPFVGYNRYYGPWIEEIDLGLKRSFQLTERQRFSVEAQVFNLFNHPNFYTQYETVLGNQYTTYGSTCGDGTSANQTCYMVPDPTFGTLTSIDQLHGPRRFQFSFHYSF